MDHILKHAQQIHDIALNLQKIILDKQQLLLIGIDGFSGSGKSSIAESLKNELIDAYIIHIDDFLVKEKMGIPNSDKEAFDRARLKHQVLQPLHKGRSASFQKLVWKKNILSEPIPVPTVSFVIIEGISVLHPDISSFFDYRIWVDISSEVAVQRGVQRDMSHGHDTTAQWQQWSKNDQAYKAKNRPDESADAIINNN